MEQVRVVETPSQAWEARILPLNYTRNDKFIITLIDLKINRLFSIIMIKYYTREVCL